MRLCTKREIKILCKEVSMVTVLILATYAEYNADGGSSIENL